MKRSPKGLPYGLLVMGFATRFVRIVHERNLHVKQNVTLETSLAGVVQVFISLDIKRLLSWVRSLVRGMAGRGALLPKLLSLPVPAGFCNWLIMN